MILENLFGNTFGLIWLIVFLVFVLMLLIWLLLKKEEEKSFCCNEKNGEEIEKNLNGSEYKEIEQNNKEYEIIESSDGFFRVKKIVTDKVLRKFVTKAEAENFVKEKENITVKNEVDEKVFSVYEIISGEDGFFRVKKKGADRTLRKFSTKEEAEIFVKEKENV